MILLSGFYSIIYVTPELLDANSDFIVKIYETVGIDLVAIDECHCISQWGHEFRPTYRKLANLRHYLKDTPFMALTATATPAVRKDILDLLALNDPIVTVTSFDRPNLYLSVSGKQNILADLRKFMVLNDKKQYAFDGPTIIYCPKRETTHEIAASLQRIGVKAEAYHAGLPLKDRNSVQQDFTKDLIDVIVATIAFGMGIDKPDIRNVIHYGAPRDVEGYYQEIGRAGRDGLPSRCHVFYQSDDFNTNRWFISQSKNEKAKVHKELMLVHLQDFLSTAVGCRRQIVLDHFKNDPQTVIRNGKGIY